MAADKGQRDPAAREAEAASLFQMISTKEAQIRIYIGYFFSLLALAGLVFGFLGNGTVASCTAIGIMMYRMGVLSQRWNPDGKGARPVPEQYRDFMTKKRRQMFQTLASSLVAGYVVSNVAIFIKQGFELQTEALYATGQSLLICTVISLVIILMA